MGARSNTVILGHNDEIPVWIYSHWGGQEFQDLAVKGELSQDVHERRGDTSYFTARPIKYLLAHNPDGISGIGTSIEDNEYPILFIDARDGSNFFAEERDVLPLLGLPSSAYDPLRGA